MTKTTHYLLLTFSFLLLPPTIGLSQAKPGDLKIYISADMEGLGGVVSERQVSSGKSEYEPFREFMTAEVNAAIEAAIEAGATEIVVSDSHGSGQNILVDKLHPEGRLVRSFPRELDMMHGIDGSFDAAIFVGYHAGEWRPGVLSHTMDGNIIELKLNGVNMGEPGFNAAIAGHFGVPVAAASGDQVMIDDLKRLVPGLEGAEVKYAYGRTSALTLHPTKVRQLIREATLNGLSRLQTMEPYQVQKPITMDLTFKNEVTAEVASMIPTVERTAANGIRIVVPDMPAAARFIALLMYVNTPSD
jgi:D-amino peptidase